MPREVDPKSTRKALRRVRRLAAKAPEADAPTPDYSGWEREFLSEVEGRLEKYGSAFANLGKGRAEDALSTLQAQKLREIERKAKAPKNDADGKPRPRSSFKRKPPKWAQAKADDDT